MSLDGELFKKDVENGSEESERRILSIRSLIALRLQEIMNQHSLSQTEFGKKIGESPQQVNRWMTGRAGPTLAQLREISRVFGVSFDFLLADGIDLLLTSKNQEPAPKEETVIDVFRRELREAFAVYMGTWLNLSQAARYCNVSIVHFNKTIRKEVSESQSVRPVAFRREKLDAAMEARQIGNLPSPRGSTSTAPKGGSKRGL